LKIRVDTEIRDGQTVVMVADNGIGIAPEFRERVFEVFERLHRASDHPGTGIGLALVKRIIEADHGRVWIEDAAGDGAESGVRVCFVLATAEERR